MGDTVKSIATGGMSSALKKLKPKEPVLPREGRELDEEAEEASRKEQERLRRGAGSNRTRKSGSVAEALNAAIGKTTLGGVE